MERHDIVFCFDSTGSMNRCISAVKYHVNRFFEGLAAIGNCQPDWRVRIMGYRDFEFDEEYLINDNPFVSTLEEVKQQFWTVEPKEFCGGDNPESTIDGIWYAMCKTEWRNDCHKSIVVFTDAVPKRVNEKTLRDISGSDDDVEVLMQELNVRDIQLFLFGEADPIYEKLGMIPNACIHQIINSYEFLSYLIDYNQLMFDLGVSISKCSNNLKISMYGNM